jgi:amino acid transporter
LIVLLLGLWWFGWAGTVFLSSTRVVFAAAFDRLLPEKVAEVSPTLNTPVYALLLMAIPAAIVSYLYAYYPGFATLTLDTTLVIAITYLGTTIAAIILPYVKPDLYNASPVAQYKILGIPLITVAGVIFGAFLVYNIYLWFTNALYGVNNPLSLRYMGVMYLLAIAIYVVAYFYRRSKGIDMNKVHSEIPVE